MTEISHQPCLFQQGSVSSEAELSQYFSHDGTSHIPFSDAVTGSCDEEQLRQKNRSGLLDDSSLLPGNLNKPRKCPIIWLMGGESLSADLLYRRAVVIPVLIGNAWQHSANQCSSHEILEDGRGLQQCS